MRLKKIIALGFLPLALLGCSHIQETAKTFWGSSTRALEEARDEALHETFSCGFTECYRDVLLIAEDQGYLVFLKDLGRGVIVLMNIPGAVDTTEVGVFFVSEGEDVTRIEVSSLSLFAKTVAAEILFEELAKQFPSP